MDVNLTLIICGALLTLVFAYALLQQAYYKLTDRIRSARRQAPVPPNGVTARIRTREATYHTRFLGSSTSGWAFESLAHAIPLLRMGTPAVVEVSCRGGAIRFRSEVVEIRLDKDAMLMRPPLEADVSDRRNKRRILFNDRPRVTLEKADGWLLDIGEGGARVSTDQNFRRGERVKLQAPGLGDPIKGHVIDVSIPRGAFREVRIVFEEPMPMRYLKKKFAPAR